MRPAGAASWQTALVALVVGICLAASGAPRAHAGSGLPPGPHGSIIRSAVLRGSPAVPGARNYLVWYRSVDPLGGPVEVSGTIAVPTGRAPAGGWPLVSWAHGTTGVADLCAPSRDIGPSFPAHDYTALVRQVQARWIAAGYAVAQTDYQGLGTPGPHGYLIGTAEARAVADMALAARAIDGDIGRRWIAVGHSQGGQAAVFTDAQAQQWAPGLRLLGAVALAPASHLGLLVPLARVSPTASPNGAFMPLVIDGARTVAAIDPARILTPEALRLLPEAEHGCIGQLRDSDWVRLPLNRIYRPDADLSTLQRVLDQNDPGTQRFTEPLLVLQGGADQIVSPLATSAMAATLAQSGSPVAYRVYPGVDHRGVLAASFADALAWANVRFGR
jgi:alpha-beta hydrolase superfamily lysophospholipase